MPTTYHLIARPLWTQAQELGEIAPRDGEPFLHFSDAHQWRLSALRYCRTIPDLMLLEVDTAELDIVRENGFPHLYAPLPLHAVRSATPLPTPRDLRITLACHNPKSDGSAGSQPETEAPRASANTDLLILPELPWQPWPPQHPAPLPQRFPSAILSGNTTPEGHNLALLHDAQGQLHLQQEKMLIPPEESFTPGSTLPQVCDALGFPLGVLICSDAQNPLGWAALHAQGAAAILVPRATEPATWPTWKATFQTMARICSAYVVSVSRPEPEHRSPTVVIAPDGSVEHESLDPVVHATLSIDKVLAARRTYPGNLQPHFTTSNWPVP